MCMEIVYIVLGVMMLILGARLFWLFCGGVGFICGLEYAPLFIHGKADHVYVIIGLVLGIIGLVLAFVAQKAGAAVCGFVAGGYIALTELKEFGYAKEWIPWAVFLVGGIIGVILVLKLFRWAAIVFSSLVGAFLIAKTTHLSLELMRVLFILLVCVGIYAQATQAQKKSRNY